MELIPMHGAAGIVFFVETPEIGPAQAHCLIGEHYRLTVAEQRLLVALADGLSLAEFAERRLSTAKWRSALSRRHHRNPAEARRRWRVRGLQPERPRHAGSVIHH
jgi:hypothetical protein